LAYITWRGDALGAEAFAPFVDAQRLERGAKKR
jgi:hypothetical protein